MNLSTTPGKGHFTAYRNRPSPPTTNTWSMMTVWKIRGKNLRTVLCCTVYNSHAHTHAHTQIFFTADQHPTTFSVLSHWWLSIQPIKLSSEVLSWLSVCSKVQMVYVWFSWCHCHPSSLGNTERFHLSSAGLSMLSMEMKPIDSCK